VLVARDRRGDTSRVQRPLELAIVLALALLAVLGVGAAVLLASRREARQRRDAALPFARALRDALAPAAALTPDAGAWRLDVTLHGRHVRLRVSISDDDALASSRRARSYNARPRAGPAGG
jgi:hypothetical protein